MSDEMEIKDKFWNGYTGRVYEDGRMPEGFTMITQTLFRDGWFNMLERDFEHLEVLWTIMRGL